MSQNMLAFISSSIKSLRSFIITKLLVMHPKFVTLSENISQETCELLHVRGALVNLVLCCIGSVKYLKETCKHCLGYFCVYLIERKKKKKSNKTSCITSFRNPNGAWYGYKRLSFNQIRESLGLSQPTDLGSLVRSFLETSIMQSSMQNELLHRGMICPTTK